MKIPVGSTTHTLPPQTLMADRYRGRKIRHTFRVHGAEDWLLIYTVGGSGLYRSAAGTGFRSGPGDVTIYRPHLYQDYQFCPQAGGWDLLWAHFLPRSEWRTWLDWPEVLPGLMRLNLHEPPLRRRVRQRLQDVVRLNFGSHAHGKNLGLNALEEVVLWCDSVNPRRSPFQPDARIARALEMLTSGLAEPFSEEKLARAVGLSPSRFRHLFREQVGDSARDFQEQLRIRRARELLGMSRRTVAEIANEMGYNNPFYFTLRFKKHTGESPRAFRQRSAGKAPRGQERRIWRDAVDRESHRRDQ